MSGEENENPSLPALTIFASAAFVAFYFSCRCKHEQFDLALLAQSVGAETPADDIRGATPQG